MLAAGLLANILVFSSQQKTDIQISSRPSNANHGRCMIYYSTCTTYVLHTYIYNMCIHKYELRMSATHSRSYTNELPNEHTKNNATETQEGSVRNDKTSPGRQKGSCELKLPSLSTSPLTSPPVWLATASQLAQRNHVPDILMRILTTPSIKPEQQ